MTLVRILPRSCNTALRPAGVTLQQTKVDSRLSSGWRAERPSGGRRCSRTGVSAAPHWALACRTPAPARGRARAKHRTISSSGTKLSQYAATFQMPVNVFKLKENLKLKLKCVCVWFFTFCFIVSKTGGIRLLVTAQNCLLVTSFLVTPYELFATTAPIKTSLQCQYCQVQNVQDVFEYKLSKTQPVFNLPRTKEEIKTNSLIYIYFCSYSGVKIFWARRILIVVFCLNYWIYP